MKHGNFYIDKANFFNYLGLPTDSHVQVKDVGDGIEFYVVSEGDNGLLTNKTNEHQILRKYRLGLNIHIPSKIGEVEYIVHNGISATGRIKATTDEEVIKYIKQQQYEGEVTVVKSEIIYYNKGE